MQQNMKFEENSLISLPSTQYPQRAFQIIKQIGQGGEGQVYLAKPEGWGDFAQNVALKLQNYMAQNEMKFITELIQYQNKEQGFPFNQKSQLIRIFDVVEYQNFQILIMEQGQEDLYGLISNSKGKYTILEKIKFLKQIAQSLNFLHSNNIMHRDIKPENFIRVGNEIKLIDFGLVKETQDNKLQTPFVGTPLFQAPEIKTGSQTYSQEIDLWSLGATFYEILTESQFDANNQISNYQIMSTVPINQTVQESCEQLLSGMLQKEFKRRITIQDVLIKLNSLEIMNSIQIQPAKQFPNQFFQQQQFQKFPLAGSEQSLFQKQSQQFNNQIQQANYNNAQIIKNNLSQNDSECDLKKILLNQLEISFQQQQQQLQIQFQQFSDNFQNILMDQMEKSLINKLKNETMQLLQVQNKKVDEIKAEGYQQILEIQQRLDKYDKQLNTQNQQDLNFQTNIYQSLNQILSETQQHSKHAENQIEILQQLLQDFLEKNNEKNILLEYIQKDSQEVKLISKKYVDVTQEQIIQNEYLQKVEDELLTQTNEIKNEKQNLSFIKSSIEQLNEKLSNHLKFADEILQNFKNKEKNQTIIQFLYGEQDIKNAMFQNKEIMSDQIIDFFKQNKNISCQINEQKKQLEIIIQNFQATQIQHLNLIQAKIQNENQKDTKAHKESNKINYYSGLTNLKQN